MHSPQHWPASKICIHNMQKEARQHPPGLSFEFKPSTSFCYNCSCSGVLYELQNTRAVLRHQQQPWPVGKLGPGAHNRQHSGLKQLNSDIHLLQEEKKSFVLQVKRTTTNSCSCTGQKKNFCLAALDSLGASRTLKGCWQRGTE